MLQLLKSPSANLKPLWMLRNIAILGQSATVLFASRWLNLALPLIPLFCIIVALACVNLITWFRLNVKTAITHKEFFAQMLIDMLGLAGLLYFTGGAGNPFTSLFILQVIIAAVSLPAGYCWVVTFIAIILYTMLMRYHIDVPMLMHAHGDDFFSLHVLGMWVNFLLLAVLVAWFVARIASALRRRDRLLLEAEQLATLGLFATQAAHDLGTPLATLALLAESYRNECPTGPNAKRALIFTEQVQRCKETISRIAASAGVMRAESGRVMVLKDYLANVFERFRQSHPQLVLAVQLDGAENTAIYSGSGMENALANVLANAAYASPQHVECKAQWTTELLTVKVIDQGPGMPQEIMDSLGELGISSKHQGFGMGLYLTRIAVTRLGGRLQAKHGATGGTEIFIAIPLSRLRT